jgi:hypothetical protein
MFVTEAAHIPASMNAAECAIFHERWAEWTSDKLVVRYYLQTFYKRFVNLPVFLHFRTLLREKRRRFTAVLITILKHVIFQFVGTFCNFLNSLQFDAHAFYVYRISFYCCRMNRIIPSLFCGGHQRVVN